MASGVNGAGGNVDSGWTTNPSDTESVSQGASRIREAKSTLKDWLAVEHEVVDGEVGVHSLGSARVFLLSADDDGEPDATLASGRVWVNSDDYRVYVSDGTSWIAVNTGTTGQVAWFPRSAVPGWLVCNGQIVTAGEVVDASGASADSTALISFLNPGQTQAFLPDLLGRFIRGVDVTLDPHTQQVDPRTNLRAGADDERVPKYSYGPGASETNAWYKVFSEQYSALMDHDHLVAHSHGTTVASATGLDSGSGRTGVPATWTTGVPSAFADDDTFTAVTDLLTAAGVLTMRDPTDEASLQGGAFSSRDFADNENTTVDLTHHHTIERYYGLSSKASVKDADLTHGVPARTHVVNEVGDYSTDDTYDHQGYPVNVALWPMIKL